LLADLNLSNFRKRAPQNLLACHKATYLKTQHSCTLSGIKRERERERERQGKRRDETAKEGKER
jgi:hypothetical protein